MGRDEAHSSHIRRQSINFIDPTGSLQAVVPAPQIHDLECVRIRWRVLGILEVHATHPVALLFQERCQMVPDEAAGTGHQCPDRRQHGKSPLGSGNPHSGIGPHPGRCTLRAGGFIGAPRFVDGITGPEDPSPGPVTVRFYRHPPRVPTSGRHAPWCTARAAIIQDVNPP